MSDFELKHCVIDSISADKIVVDVSPGVHISDVIQEVCWLSMRKNKIVEFEFNGVKVDTKDSRIPDKIAELFAKLQLKQTNDYHNSPQYKRQQEESARELQATQTQIDELFSEIRVKKDAMTEANIITWLADFAPAADRVGVVYDKQEVITFLENRGYMNNDHVGDPLVKTDRTVFAKWLIGQAINCLKNDMPPHPALTERFAKEYFEIWKDQQ